MGFKAVCEQQPAMHRALVQSGWITAAATTTASVCPLSPTYRSSVTGAAAALFGLAHCATDDAATAVIITSKPRPASPLCAQAPDADGNVSRAAAVA
jgi:hypothetical protein